MVEPHPKARAILQPGALYAIESEPGRVHYAQAANHTDFGFFDLETQTVGEPRHILASALLFRVLVRRSSVGAALRAGTWDYLGIHPLPATLQAPLTLVQWPVGTLEVTVLEGGKKIRSTRVDDPSIQDLEIFAAWDAVFHIPGRLRTEFRIEPFDPFLMGPIGRMRRAREENARRYPDDPRQALPPDWVATSA
jgi:hypothetical protein